MAQIPPKGVPQVRYYGWYSNKSRGLRRRQGEKSKGEILGPPARPKRRRRAWRELIQQVWGADPLRCPLCNGLLRRIAVVETKVEILAILTPLGLARPTSGPLPSVHRDRKLPYWWTPALVKRIRSNRPTGRPGYRIRLLVTKRSGSAAQSWPWANRSTRRGSS